MSFAFLIILAGIGWTFNHLQSQINEANERIEDLENKLQEMEEDEDYE